eukprot:1262510-Prymnesium_polylepis.1
MTHFTTASVVAPASLKPVRRRRTQLRPIPRVAAHAMLSALVAGHRGRASRTTGGSAQMCSPTGQGVS